jgi:hypothetical protein
LNRVARFSTACVALGLLALSGTAGAQVRTAVSPALPDTVDPLARAMGAEDRGDMKGATVAYQQVLQRALANAVSDGDRIDMALLGLERAWAELGVRDSILPILQRVVLLRRTDPVARGIQLRALIATNQDDAARLAFTDWRRSAPNEAAPYREYARNLLGAGRAQAADTVLADAARFLGSSRDISGEVAQLNVALERWIPAAVAYRTAVIEQPWMQTAALFALQRVPVALRDSVRTTFAAAPVVLGPRRLLSNLELGWSEPRKAWVALAALAVDDSTIAAWREFGERAEFAESWLVARDAWAAVLEKRGDLDAARRRSDGRDRHRLAECGRQTGRSRRQGAVGRTRRGAGRTRSRRRGAETGRCECAVHRRTHARSAAQTAGRRVAPYRQSRTGTRGRQEC